ncbi:glycosyltransferase [uncultured Ruminococcus sp.]|uniref:glycosyltransferase n=1 Tax=uncultured Ruminococcus sp. TaxID=165186 RepID=UPI0029319378|nr:glycosyltransferase [uncultured Ruminococcus sp.]
MMNPKDIRSAQFLDAYYPIVDGVVTTVHNYAELMNRTAYSCVVTPRPMLPYDDSGLSYEVYRTSALKIPIAEYATPVPKLDGKVRQFLRNRNIDIFHAHSPFMEGTFASSYAKKLGIPSVATFHSKYYDDAVNITGSKTLAKIVAAKVVRFYNSVDSVWACSEGTANTLRSYGYRGDIFVMDNGTTFEMPQNPDILRKKAAEAFKIPEDKHILLFVGHQIWHKNLKLILDTFKLLDENSDDYRLFIVGNGYDAQAIRKYADDQNFRDGHVNFVGKISDRDVLSGLYLSADLFFFPSVYDNSPLVVREAASMGVPSLLTEGSNAAEAVMKDVSGFTAKENKVAMFREILRIFGTPGLLEKVSDGALHHVAKTWKEIVPLVQDKYAEIIEEYRFKHKND